MAIELIARIWRRPPGELDSSEKFVLTIMADRADDDGLLWYAVDTIADLTSFTPRAVQKIMARLIAKQMVKKLQRRDRSNYYVIQLDKFPHVERVKRQKEQGPAEFVAELDAEPDLFGTGEPGSGTGERRSSTGEPGSGTGERRSPDSLNDSLNDPPTDAHTREGDGSIYDLIVTSWNTLAAEHEALAQFRGAMTDERKRKIDARTKDGRGMPVVQAMLNNVICSPDRAVWRCVFATFAQSKLLTGQKTAWAPSFDWMLGPKNFAKIMEGNYGHGHDSIGSANGPGERSAAAAGRAARDLVERSRNGRGSSTDGPGRHSRKFAGAHR